MKNLTTLLLLFTLFGLSNCTNQKENLDSSDEIYRQQEVGKLNSILKKYETPSQIFKIPFDKPSMIKGKNGTAISVNPNDLETTDGKSVSKTIEVELKELLNQSQLLRNNAQTVSDGKILVSGGAYYINMTSDRQQLKLKKGKTLSVGFPKISDNEMSLFYGEKDSLGKMDWQKSETKFVSVNFEVAKAKSGIASNPVPTKPVRNYALIYEGDSLISNYNDSSDTNSEFGLEGTMAIEKHQSTIMNQVYEVVELKQLGWINCDRFLEIKDVTNLKFEFNPKDSVVVASVYLVFKDINSVIGNSYFSFKGKTFDSSFDGVPVGSNVRLIAFSQKKGKLFSHSSELTIVKNQKVKIALYETSEKELRGIFE